MYAKKAPKGDKEYLLGEVHKYDRRLNLVKGAIIYLIDDNSKIIYSYEKIYFISFINCRTKYNRYLLYPTKPKNFNTNYSIHIGIYETIT